MHIRHSPFYCVLGSDLQSGMSQRPSTQWTGRLLTSTTPCSKAQVEHRPSHFPW